jgi:hypothetical protein
MSKTVLDNLYKARWHLAFILGATAGYSYYFTNTYLKRHVFGLDGKYNINYFL